MLEKIQKPNDIKKIPADQLPALAEEIRKFIIESLSKTGGHLASNLGVVELTIAMHRVFNLPKDKLIWDVGHQSYTHKILTGRKDGFETLRREGGSRKRAMATVSAVVNSRSIPCRTQLCSIKLISNEALWATITAPSLNSRNFGSTVSMSGASRTMLSLMPVRFSIRNGIGTFGLTKVENLSTIAPFSTRTAPISMILLTTGENPVVSISNTT